MTRLTHVHSPEGVAPGNGYSHAVSGTGRFVAVSGRCAFDADGMIVSEGDPAAQARQVFENLRRCLAGAGAVPEVRYARRVRASEAAPDSRG